MRSINLRFTYLLNYYLGYHGLTRLVRCLP